MSNRKINLNKSIIDFQGRNLFRTNIKSILSSKNRNFFLVKECRAELIGKNPFDFKGKYEFLCIAGDNETNIFRTSPIDFKSSLIDSKKEKIEVNSWITNKKNLVESDIEYFSFDQVYEIVSAGKPNDIFCEIEYEFQNVKYNLITKCEHINYSNLDENEKFIQPIMGYVPFVLNKKLNFGYVVLYLKKKGNGNLEFLLNEKSNLFNIYENGTPVKKVIKKILNKLLSLVNIILLVKKNNFTKVVSIKDSKFNFFTYK